MKLIIFDLDGTLVDTLEDLKNSINVIMKMYGFPPRTHEEIKSFVGNGIKKLVERAVPCGTSEEIIESCYEKMLSYYGQHSVDLTKPYSGILELLYTLHSKEIKVIVVTNKVQKSAEVICEKFFENLVDGVVGDDKITPLKPAPDNIFRAMALVGADKSDVIYVGDSEVDALTAKNAGVSFIGASWGFRSRETLIKNGALKIADSVEELKALLYL